MPHVCKNGELFSNITIRDSAPEISDTDRLEWMIKTGSCVNEMGAGFYVRTRSERVFKNNDEIQFYKTGRKAIDAAMKDEL